MFLKETFALQWSQRYIAMECKAGWGMSLKTQSWNCCWLGIQIGPWGGYVVVREEDMWGCLNIAKNSFFSLTFEALAVSVSWTTKSSSWDPLFNTVGYCTVFIWRSMVGTIDVAQRENKIEAKQKKIPKSKGLGSRGHVVVNEKHRWRANAYEVQEWRREKSSIHEMVSDWSFSRGLKRMGMMLRRDKDSGGAGHDWENPACPSCVC